MGLCPSVLLLAAPVINTVGARLLPAAATVGATHLLPPLPLQAGLLVAAVLLHTTCTRSLVAQLCSFLSIKCFVIARKRDV